MSIKICYFASILMSISPQSGYRIYYEQMQALQMQALRGKHARHLLGEADQRCQLVLYYTALVLWLMACC